MRVGLTYDLDPNIPAGSSEQSQVAAALESLGHEVIRIGSATELVDKLAAGARFDVVFNCCRGMENAASESRVPELLNIYDVPCTFSSPATLNVCNQLSTMKSLLRDRGIPTSDYWLVETLGDIQRVDASYPVTVGPTVRCCRSKCFVANDASELSKACCHVMSQFATPVLIEPVISGQKFHVALLGSGSAATALLPANTPSALTSSMERIASAAWRAVGGCDAGCVTLLCDTEGLPHVASIEPLPSLAMSGSFMRLAQAADVSLENVVSRIMDTCIHRAGLECGHQVRRPHMVDQSVDSSSDAALAHDAPGRSR